MSTISDLMPSLGLSATEMGLFKILAASPNAVVPREALMSALKGSSPRTIDSHIMGIRRKLERSGTATRIETVKHQGFILRTSAS